MPGGARPVFAEGKDRLRWAFLFWAHLSLGGIVLWMLAGWDFYVFKLGFVGEDVTESSETRAWGESIPHTLPKKALLQFKLNTG